MRREPDRENTRKPLARRPCIRAKEGKLSPMCQQFFDVARAREEAARKACGDEGARACPGVTPGRGALWICLGLGGADLSDGCRAAL